MKWMVREPTDVMCCFIFSAFIFGMLVLSGVGISSGSPSIIFTPFDSDGNMCGQELQIESAPDINDIRDFTEYKYKFFTNLHEFSINQEDGVDALKNALSNTIIYSAVCVKECPVAAEVDSSE